MTKTQAMRHLDRLKVPYTVRSYAIDPDHLQATHVAELMGVDPWSLYKTLVVQGYSRACYLALIPGPSQLDLKKLARVTQEKAVDLIPVSQLATVTGYVRGGVSPFAVKKRMPLYIQIGIDQWSQVSVSAGRRGLQILMSGHDLLRAAAGQVADMRHPDV